MELRDLKAFVTLGRYCTLVRRRRASTSPSRPRASRSAGWRRTLAAAVRAQHRQHPATGRCSGAPSTPTPAPWWPRARQLARSARDVLAGHGYPAHRLRGRHQDCWCPPPSPAFGPAAPGSPSSSTISHPSPVAGAGGRAAGSRLLPPARPRGWPGAAVVAPTFVAVLPAGYPGWRGSPDLQEKPLAILRRDEAPSFYDQFIHYLAQERAALFRTSSTSTTSPPASPRRPASPGPWSPPPPPLGIPMC